MIAEHQKNMSDISRKLQLVATMSSERLEKATTAEKNLVDNMNRSQEQLAQQLRGLAQLLQGQDVLVQTQSVLAGNLRARIPVGSCTRPWPAWERFWNN